MSFDTAKRIVDFYYTHTIDSEKIAIAFYGGEPTLEFDLIKKIVTYANSLFKGKEILYRMTTNATLFADEMIEFFLIRVMTSLFLLVWTVRKRFMISTENYQMVMEVMM